MSFSEKDHAMMQRALQLADVAERQGEVPVGAVMVLNDEIIGEGFNQPILQKDPTAHAEIIALRQAAESVGNYRIVDTTLYVTLEPCLMCAGAMVHARIKRLIFGALDQKAGAICCQAHLLDANFLNHHIDYANGLLDAECGLKLSQFFQKKRTLQAKKY